VEPEAAGAAAAGAAAETTGLAVVLVVVLECPWSTNNHASAKTPTTSTPSWKGREICDIASFSAAHAQKLNGGISVGR
jgi:hypothetical protein